jgi:hypothetical protein
VFVGTGTAGAYHAGVLRALLEAGVRVDVVAGRGIGAATALFAAVDAASRLWDAAGAWRGRPGPRGLYGWRASWRLLAVSLIVAVGLLGLPLLILAALALAYPVLLLVGLLWPPGLSAMARWHALGAWISGPEVLASLVPRLVAAAMLVACGTVMGLYIVARWREGPSRQTWGALWWRALGAPFDARRAVRWTLDGFWQFMRGAASIAPPLSTDLGRRYAELLSENLGQPGYRELILLAHDVDTRRDLVFALLADPWRKHLALRIASGGAGEIVDLAGAGRIHVADAVAAALSPPVACEPHLVTFAPESFWRGETHRLCDRPSGITRLLREAIDAGASQIIVVSSSPPVMQPHALRRPRAHPRDRLGDVLESMEAAAVADAVAAVDGRVRAVFQIRPAHNAVGAFDFGGSHDEASDRQVVLTELMERGYEDAYRQLLEPIIGASGEQIHGATVVGPTPVPGERARDAIGGP